MGLTSLKRTLVTTSSSSLPIISHEQSLAPTQVGGIPPTWVGGTTQKLTCVLVMCIAHDKLNSPLTPLLYSETFRFLSLSCLLCQPPSPSVPTPPQSTTHSILTLSSPPISFPRRSQHPMTHAVLLFSSPDLKFYPPVPTSHSPLLFSSPDLKFLNSSFQN